MNITRESIFTSSLRAFCTAFFSVLGLGACVLLIIIALSMFKNSSTTSASGTNMTIQRDADGNKDLLPLHTPAILKINIHGVIGDKRLTTKTVEAQLADSRENLLKSGRVKGILLHIDTPGGTVTDSNGIYEILMEYKKKYHVPIFAYVDGLCASGGMYISSAADKIYSSDVSIIGSVGVILGPAFNFLDLLNHYGVHVKMLSEGKDKTMLNSFGDWEKTSDVSLENITKHLYSHFVDLVCSARPRLNKELLVNEYGAQVYSAPEAENLGYIDVANSSYSSALRDLVKEAGILSDEKYQVVELKPHKTIIQEFFDVKLDESASLFSKILNLTFENQETKKHPWLYLYKVS